MIFIKELGSKVIFFDGAMGSILQARGLSKGEPPETLNITQPNIVTEIHKEYLLAGSDIITANTFGAYATRYPGLEDIIAGALKCVKTAINETGCDALTALDMGPTGRLLKPLGDMTFDECYNIYSRSAILGEKYGADLIIIETMTDIGEARAAVLAVKENTSLPVICTVTFDEHGRTLTGSSIEIIVSVLEGLGVDALGINCGFGPATAKRILNEMIRYASVPVLVQPNAGLPRVENGVMSYDVSPAEFANEMAAICAGGAFLLGGCCGTTPEHIRVMKEYCQSAKPSINKAKSKQLCSSYNKLALVDSNTRISHMNTNLNEADIDDIIDEVLELVDDGTDIISIEVNGADENRVEEIISSIQGVTGIPLAFTASESNVMEKALRIYNGRAGLINGKTGRCSATLDHLITKYGGIVIG